MPLPTAILYAMGLTKEERDAAARERAEAAADELREQVERERLAKIEAIEIVKTSAVESKRVRRAFIRSLFAAYKLGATYQELADACDVDVAGVYRLMRRHAKDGKRLTVDKRGRDDLLPKRAVGR